MLYGRVDTESLYCKQGGLQSEMCKDQVNITLMLMVIIQGFYLSNDPDTVWLRDKTKWRMKWLFNTHICSSYSLTRSSSQFCSEENHKIRTKMCVIVQNFIKEACQRKKGVQKGNLGKLSCAGCSPQLTLVLNSVSHCLSPWQWKPDSQLVYSIINKQTSPLPPNTCKRWDLNHYNLLSSERE